MIFVISLLIFQIYITFQGFGEFIIYPTLSGIFLANLEYYALLISFISNILVIGLLYLEDKIER